jgi:hypothetical protein
VTALWTPATSAAPLTFTPDNLVVSRSVYQGTAATVVIGQLLPPNCPSTAQCGGTGNKGKPATDTGAYPAIGSSKNVWNNDAVDSSFGVTSPIFLDEISSTGTLLGTLPVDPSRIVTSFSSKSELALNRSSDRSALTFMGYVTPVNTLDASNANTPGVVDPTNPVGENVYRAVALVAADGGLQITDTNAYSGNNGRAAALANGLYYAVGNNNNGSGPPAPALLTSTGAELIVPGAAAGTPQMIGNFSVTQYGHPADKPGKDNNFRGLTIFNNTLYVTKGSGSNGINTVYQVGSAGSLPTAATATNEPITILPGFPTVLAKDPTAQNPFGIFFADARTLYVADEGTGVMADAAISPNAGLQKWVLNNGVWQRVYVLRQGLHLGQSYSVANYPAALNPAPDGLRNLTGRVNADGTVDLWAITSTVSTNGDQGADPNQLVFISDQKASTDPATASNESFVLLETAKYGEVLRGVSFAPGTVASKPGGPTACDGVYSGQFSGNIRVSAGQRCVFIGGGISGNVEVVGGTFELSNATLDGNLQVGGSSAVSLGPATSVTRNVALDDISGGATPITVCDTHIGGNLEVQGNASPVQLGSDTGLCRGNTVTRNAAVENNTGATQVFTNTIGGNLQCSGNTTITGGGNTAARKQGQCARF